MSAPAKRSVLSTRLVPSLALAVAVGIGAGGPLAAQESEEVIVDVGEDTASTDTDVSVSDAPGEGQPEPDADQRLQALAQELELATQGRAAAAEHHYTVGMKAYREGRLAEAIKSLTKAVDYQPGNERYSESLREVSAAAGVLRDPRDVFVNEIADVIDVENQRLWIEIQRAIEDGQKHMAAEEYTEAHQSFTMAKVRLESLPFADTRREEEMRRVQTLLAENAERRKQQELEIQRSENQAAQERKQELRQHELRLEKKRIDSMLARALKARERRDFDECILYCEQILKINRAESRAHNLLVRARRERHVYLRQITAHAWEEEHTTLFENIREDMLPQLDLVVYSDDWHEIDRRRSAPVRDDVKGQDEQAWRQEIEYQLDQKLTLEFLDNDIGEVVEFLQQNTSVNIVLDPEVLALDPGAITMTVRDMQLRNVLDFIMIQTGLRYSLQDEALYISTEEGMRGDVTMKIYDISDLTLPLTDFPGPRLRIPEPGESQGNILDDIVDEDAPEIEDFIDIIREVVQPDSWDAEGVSIEEHYDQMVVTQTIDIHRQIEDLLRELRNQRGVQINVGVKFLTVDDKMLEFIGFDWTGYGQNPNVPGPAGTGSAVDTEPGPPRYNSGFGSGAYWSGDDYVSYGTSDTSQMANYFEDTGFGDPLASNNGLSAQWQFIQDPDGLLGSVILNAVEQGSRGNESQEPSITLFNGQRAHILNITQQAYISDFDVASDQYDPIISVIPFGTVLDVEAVASADRKYITLTLQPTAANLDEFREFVIQNNVLSYPLRVPILDFDSVQTSVVIPDGGSMVIAGMTDASSRRNHQGIPFLSHIPFLGRLFSSNGRGEVLEKTLITVSADIILYDELEEKL